MKRYKAVNCPECDSTRTEMLEALGEYEEWECVECGATFEVTNSGEGNRKSKKIRPSTQTLNVYED